MRCRHWASHCTWDGVCIDTWDLFHLVSAAPSIRAAVARVRCPLVPGWSLLHTHLFTVSPDVRLGGCFVRVECSHPCRTAPNPYGREHWAIPIIPASSQHRAGPSRTSH